MTAGGSGDSGDRKGGAAGRGDGGDEGVRRASRGAPTPHDAARVLPLPPKLPGGGAGSLSLASYFECGDEGVVRKSGFAAA
jgi:hypothetical protein